MDEVGQTRKTVRYPRGSKPVELTPAKPEPAKRPAIVPMPTRRHYARTEGVDYVAIGRTTCEVCGISVLLSRRPDYGPNRCKLHRATLEARAS
jgi:hypothetical protein